MLLVGRCGVRGGGGGGVAKHLLHRGAGVGTLLSLPLLPQPASLGDVRQLVEHGHVSLRILHLQVSAFELVFTFIDRYSFFYKTTMLMQVAAQSCCVHSKLATYFTDVETSSRI